MTVSEAGKKGGEVRGRQMKGDGNPNRKIDASQAKAIQDCSTYKQAVEVGKDLGISEGHTFRVWKKEYWNG